MNNPTSIQYIEQGGRRAFAVVPIEEFKRMLAALEDQQDVADADRIMAAIDSGEEETVPDTVVKALLAGENPVRVWREYRSMTQQQLADACGWTKGYISRIERGSSAPGRAGARASLAQALGVSEDDLFVG